MAASLSDVFNQYSIARIFGEEILQKLFIMRDMVQEMVEDRKESGRL